jgi:hypothetical protein
MLTTNFLSTRNKNIFYFEGLFSFLGINVHFLRNFLEQKGSRLVPSQQEGSKTELNRVLLI